MTDRELLELAAKAAGIEGRFIGGFDHLGLCISELGNPIKVWWNPLTDDGDALRLAVKLNLSIVQTGMAVNVSVVGCRSSMEPNQSDPYSATRRAIVRAAAEIGKGMK